MDSWPHLAVTTEGAVAEVRLNRPAARNALSLSLMQQLIDAAAHFRKSTQVQAVIVAGAETYFSAGADLADPARAESRGATRMEQRQIARLGPDMCAAWEELEQVTIAAVEGYCIGGAAALAVALDFRIAGEGAYFRLPEIALGMNMSWRTLPRLASLVGPSRAKRFAIFCEPCAADEALAWGPSSREGRSWRWPRPSASSTTAWRKRSRMHSRSRWPRSNRCRTPRTPV